MKKLMTLLLTLCFISGSIFADKTPEFKDLDKAKWAKKYVEKVAELGIVKGYENNLFKPNKDITKCNSILMMYRMINEKSSISSNTEKEILDKYKKLMDKKDLPSYDKVREAIGYFVDKGIISEDSLDTFMKLDKDKKNKTQRKISRQEVCYFLGAFLNKELNGSIDKSIIINLDDIKDSDKIDSKYMPYISLLHEEGIVEGDNNKNFNPKKSITRAEFSALMYRTLEVLDNGDKKIPTEVEIKKINAETKEITFFYKEYKTDKKKIITDDIAIYVDDEKASFNDLKVDMNAKVVYEKYRDKEKKPKLVEIRAEKIDEEIKSLGKVKKVDKDSGLIYYDDEHSTQTDKQFEVDRSMKIYLDGDEIPISKIMEKQHLSAQYKNGKLVAVKLTSQSKRFSGIITNVNSNKNEISIDVDGKVKTYNVPNNCSISKDGHIEVLSNLKVGNKATLTSKYDKIIVIETEPSVQFGVINGIYKGTDGQKARVEISYGNGDVKTYPIEKDIDIIINGNVANQVFDLKVNSNVTLYFDGEALKKIEAHSYGNKIGLEGYIKSINYGKNSITVEVLKNSYGNAKFSYELMLKDASILDINSKKIGIGDLKKWQKVFFYGYKDKNYNKDTVLKVEKLIILEEGNKNN